VEIEKDRFTMQHIITSEMEQRVVTEGSGLIVTFDYREQKKVNVPEYIVEGIRRLEQTIGTTASSSKT
jgi:acyl-CoA thioester hydrolase